MKAGIVKIKDVATSMLGLVAKFDEKDQLGEVGWAKEDIPKLSLVCTIGANETKCALHTFHLPEIDLRSSGISVDKTTICLAKWASKLDPHKEIPKDVDFTNTKC